MIGIFLDIETNGLDPFRHEPLEIAIVLKDLFSGATRAEYQSQLRCDTTAWSLKDPASLTVNGFSFEELERAASKKEVAADITRLFQEQKITRGKAVFVCQNPSFDRPFFAKILSPYVQEQQRWPYHWLDLASMYWARFLVFDQTGRQDEILSVSKDTIAERFGLPKEQHPHRAMNGVRHLLQCYERVVGYPKEQHA